MARDGKTNTQKQRLIILTCISGLLVIPPVLFFLQFLLGSFPTPLAQLTDNFHKIYDENWLLTIISIVCIVFLFKTKATDGQTGLRIAKTTTLLCNGIALITVQKLYKNSAIEGIVQPVVDWISSVPLWQSILVGAVLLLLLALFIWVVHKAGKDPISKSTPDRNGDPPAGGSGGTSISPAEGSGGTSTSPAEGDEGKNDTSPKEKSNLGIHFDRFVISYEKIGSFLLDLFFFILFTVAVVGAIFFTLCLFDVIQIDTPRQTIIAVASIFAWTLFSFLNKQENEERTKKILDAIGAPASLFISFYLIRYLFSDPEINDQLWPSFFNILESHSLAALIFIPLIVYYLLVLVRTLLDIFTQREKGVAKRIRKTVVRFEKNLVKLVETLLDTTIDTLNDFITESASSMMKVFFEIDANGAKDNNDAKDNGNTKQ